MTAEIYLAGALLIDGDKVLPQISDVVSADDFQYEVCGAVFSAALELASRGETIDPLTVQKAAKRAGVELTDDTLRELMERTPTAANCVEYACHAHEDARTRRIKALAARIQEDNTSTPDELLETMQRETTAIRGGNYRRGLLSPADSMHRLIDHMTKVESGACSFIPSGFSRLDQILGDGFIRGGLYILGARPAVGKTTFAINLADSIKGNCLFVSLEMTPEQITAKRISRLTGLSATKLLSGKITDKEWTAVSLACGTAADGGLYLNSRYDLTVSRIQMLAQSVPELKAVIIDYLGLIRPATNGGKLYETTTQISRDLKQMAITLNVPVICLCQLSRTVENRENKRPRLSDLRDSGAIEQDADAVMFLYREDYYTGNTADGDPSLVELLVEKNRHGKCGSTAFSAWLTTNKLKEVP